MKKRQTLMRAFAQTHRAWNNHVRDLTLKVGIPDSYRTVLLFLYRHPGSGQCAIAEFANVTASAINQTVKSMLKEDYLLKEIDPSDKRNNRLYLTEKGINIAEKLFDKLDASDDAITAMIGEAKEKELIDFLEHLADYIRKDLCQC